MAPAQRRERRRTLPGLRARTLRRMLERPELAVGELQGCPAAAKAALSRVEEAPMGALMKSVAAQASRARAASVQLAERAE